MPNRINKAIELLEQGQPVYYIGSHTGAELTYEAVGDDESLTYAASAAGRLDGWRFTLSATRSWKEDGNITTERLPEVTLSREALRIGPATLTPRLSAGSIREWKDGSLSVTFARNVAG